MAAFFRSYKAAWQAFCILSPVLLCTLILSIGLGILYKIYNRNDLRSILMVFAAFSIFGAMVGTFIGVIQSTAVSEKSPIVASLLPPIITLIPSFMAFQSSKKYPGGFKSILPGAIFLLFLNLLFAAFYIKSLPVV